MIPSESDLWSTIPKRDLRLRPDDELTYKVGSCYNCGSKMIIRYINDIMVGEFCRKCENEDEKSIRIQNGIYKKPKSQRNTIPKELRHGVFKRDNYRCVECGATNKEKTLHIDHIIPKSKGGLDKLNNLQTLCVECNVAKSNRNWVGGI